MIFFYPNVIVSHLLQCNKHEFTCDDGRCIDLEARCNFLYDCPDGSDEKNCKIMSIEEEKYQNIFPPVSNGTKTEVFVRMDILSITNIDEMAMTFTSKLGLSIQWRDQRITFNNLNSNGNFLIDSQLDQIWLPPLIFSNTKEFILISGKDHVDVKILKQGPPTLNEPSELKEEETYRGDENDLLLTAYHQHDFDCNFELSNFPFDLQKCSIDIMVAEKFSQYIILKPKELNFPGN